MDPVYKVWPTALEARVAAVNLAHAYAKDLWSILHELCKPFVGCKIYKADGGLMANFEKAIKTLDLPCRPAINVYRNADNYSLSWCVRVSQGSKSENHRHSDGSHYHDISVYVGSLNGKILKDVIFEAPNLRTDFTVDEILAKREAYRVAKKASDDAFSALHPFGECDR